MKQKGWNNAMTFLGLFNKIGRQPIKNTRDMKVLAVLYRDDLKKLLNENRYSQTVTIPLDIKFGNGKQKIWFILDKKGEKNGNKNSIV